MNIKSRRLQKRRSRRTNEADIVESVRNDVSGRQNVCFYQLVDA